MEKRLVYITTANRNQAREIGQVLVETRLAACVNVIDGMISMYWWEGKVQTDSETVLIAKTTEALVPELVRKVKEIHSYEVPCVVALPIVNGNLDFLDWIQNETKSGED